MKNIDNKGFTLVELVATILILGLIMGIGGYSITNLIQKNKQNSYNLLIKEIKESLNSYYQECRYANIPPTCSNNGNIKLGDLIEQGFLKGNKKMDDNSYGLINPNNEKDIYSCIIDWEYSNGKFIITDKTGGNCPSTEDYS